MSKEIKVNISKLIRSSHPTEEKDYAKLTEMVKLQGRASARIVDEKDIIEEVKKIDYRFLREIGICRKDLDGVRITLNTHPEKFPNAYRWTPESTWLCIYNRRGEWHLTEIYRGRCTTEWYEVLTMTEETKNAIVEAAMRR